MVVKKPKPEARAIEDEAIKPEAIEDKAIEPEAIEPEEIEPEEIEPKPPEAQFVNALGAPTPQFLPTIIGQWSFRAFSKRLSDEKYWRRMQLDKYKNLGAKARQSPIAIEIVFALCWENVSAWTQGWSQTASPYPELTPPAEYIDNSSSPIPDPYNNPTNKAAKAWVMQAVKDWGTRREFVLALPDEVLGLYLWCAEADYLVTGAPSPHTTQAKKEREVARLRALNHIPMQGFPQNSTTRVTESM